MTNPDPAATAPHSVPPPFFVTGGTLPLDAASYVARIADEELYQSLRRGEFCYVLNTRQMGKSSLMIRAAQRLREDGKQVLILDLTGAGQNLSVEQWYFGLLDLVAMQTRREDELVAFWKTHRDLGPMQRFVAALQRVLLTPQEPTPSQEPSQRTADGEQTQSDGAGELVIFIDEIDAVRSLPFSADEFFAGIRECCNRNAQNATGRRLVFCLLGVATPSDLIRDTRVTPFNVGRRIELRDFTREEAAPLAEGLRHNRDAREATALLDRVLYWTGGHPYMTQRLCRAVAENLAAPGQNGNSSGRGRDEIEDAALVDTLCQTLFLAKSARETDDNLAFVRTRLLHNEEGRAALLDLYGQARRGKRVKDDETNPLCPILRLSGVVKAENGRLVVRNEIYARVFDAAWIAEYMPDAEVRRQKRAFRRGVVRAAIVFGSVTLVIGALLFVAVINAKRARVAEAKAQKQTAYAREQTQIASQLLYDANMNQIQSDWQLGNFTVANGLLEETKGSSARGFEWDYWNRLQNEYAAPLPITNLFCAVIAPDNRTVGAIVKDEQSPEKGRFTARDIVTGITRFSTPARCIASPLAYAPDGSRLLLCVGKTVEVRDAQNGRLLQTMPAQQEDVLSFQFTADGAAILVARKGGLLTLWDCHTEKTLWERKISAIDKVCIATSDKSAATITAAGVTQIWEIETGDELYRNDRNFNCGPMAFSPDGRFLVGWPRGDGIEILDMSTREMRNRSDRSGPAFSYHFSPDGRRLMVGYLSRICAYDVQSGRLLSDPPKSSNSSEPVIISPNGLFALLAERDDKLHFVRTTPIAASLRLIPPAAPHVMPDGKSRRAAVGRSQYSPDGRLLATPCFDGNVYIWDTNTTKLLQTLRGDGVAALTAAFSHDGSRLVVGDMGGRVSLWDLRGGQRLVQFRAHTTPDTHVPGQTGIVEEVGFMPDDRQILTSGEDYTAKIWDWAAQDATAPTLNRTLQGHTNGVESFLLAPDGATLLTASDDRTAKLWDRRTGRLLSAFKSPAEIWGAAFSPDGRQIALANLYKTIEVWDIRAKRKLHTLSGHLDWVTCVAFSPDGKRIVSGSKDHTVKLWDAQTGRELLTLRGHTGQISNVAFAPNGRQIATVGFDGEARLWNTNTDLSDTAAGNP